MEENEESSTTVMKRKLFQSNTRSKSLPATIGRPIERTNDGFPGSRKLKTSRFADFVVKHMQKQGKAALKSHKSQLLSFYVFIFLLVTVVVLSSVSLYLWTQVTDLKYCLSENAITWNTENLHTHLTSKVFGQDKAVHDVTAVIENFQNSITSNVAVLVFCGSVGTGKTFTTLLLADHFPWKNNIQHYIYPIHFPSFISALDLERTVVSKLSTCGINLVIFDEVPAEVDELRGFQKLVLQLRKSVPQQNYKVVFVIVMSHCGGKDGIFRSSDVDQTLSSSVNEFISESSENGALASVVNFVPLRLDSVTRCIEREFQRIGIKPSKDLVLYVQNSLPWITPHKEALAGCKNVPSYVALAFSHDKNKKE